MIIKKLRADFGKLSGDELTLSPGLNVICAPNESGKSTWCAFIRAMLYGVDSSERAKAGFKPDKLRYAPWSGSPMRGEMEITHKGKDITITRSTRTQSAPLRQFSAVYTGTGEKVSGLTAANAGETLTGASKAVFERSAFIKQNSVGFGGSPELEKKISSLVSTGDEDDSYSAADERLRAWQRARRFNKKGRIPELESEISRKLVSLSDVGSAVSDREELLKKLSEAEAEIPRLKEEAAENRKRARRAALEHMTENKNLLRRLERRESDAEHALKEREAALENFPFLLETTPGDAMSQAEKAVERARELSDSAKIKTPAFTWIAALALAVVLLALGFFVSPILFIFAVLLLALAAFLFLNCKKGIKQAQHALEKRKYILERYSAADEDGIIEIAKSYARAVASVEEARQEIIDTRNAMTEAVQTQKERDAAILAELDFSGEGSAAEPDRRLAQATENIARIREELAKAEGGISVMCDPVVTETEILALEEKKAELTIQYEALQLAINALSTANAEIQTRFSPRLGKRAGELFSELTDGKYESVAVDRQFTALVRQTNESAQRDALFLSAGAWDQLYLALRLAIAELALPSEEPCPIILDDALCSFDDERMALAMDMLKRLAETRQIIIFTCQSREKEYLDSQNSPDN